MQTYKYLKHQPGRDNKDCLECCEVFASNDAKFIIYDEALSNYTVFDTFELFQQWFNNSTTRTLHEVIRGNQPQKLKFDIDGAAADVELCPETPAPKPPTADDTLGLDFLDEMMGELYAEDLAIYNRRLALWNAATPTQRKRQHIFMFIKAAIVKCMRDLYEVDVADDLVISDSSDDTKFSRHIVVKSYHVKNNIEARFFTTRMLQYLPTDIAKFVDAGVNKSLQNFRLPLCHKKDSNRVKKIITQHTPQDMMITRTNGTQSLVEFNIKAKAKAPQLDDPASQDAILQIAAPYAQGHTYHKRTGNLFTYRREVPSHCTICDRYHDTDNTMYITCNSGCVRLHCRHNQQTRVIGKIGREQIETQGEALVPKKFEPDAKIPDEFSVETYCEPGLRDFRFYGKQYDTLLIKSPMGTGKTKVLLETLKPIPLDRTIIFVSFRRSFTSELKTKLGSKIVDYRDVKGEIDAPRVIVQFESLHRLKLPVGRESILILDESESILGQLENKQMAMAGTLRDCWNKFEWLMFNATKVIAMDAYASFRTYTLLRKTRKSVYVHNNTYVPPQDKCAIDIYYDNEAELIAEIQTAAVVATTEPFVIVSTVKKQADVLEMMVKRINPQARVKSYNSDSTAEERLDFLDVNKHWADVDILIYTSTVSAGCSFELPRFKKIFAYFNPISVDYKTAIQMMGRVRNVATREYHIHIKSSDADLPETIDEVERALATRAEIASIECNPMNLPKMINATGDVEYRLKDLYYHVHVGNIVHRCQSKNRFKQLFQQCRAQSGAIVKKKGQTRVDLYNIECENKMLKTMLNEIENDAIAEACVIEDKQAEALKHAEFPTPDEKNSLKLYQLTQIYQVPPEMVDEKFVEIYNKPHMKSVFKNLNRLGQGTQSIAVAINKWRECRDSRDASVDDLNQNDNVLKCMFAVDILNALATTDGAYCSSINHFVKQRIQRKELLNNIDAVCNNLQKYTDTISLIFGVRRDRLQKPRTELRSKLDLVNTILGIAYGLTIKAAKKARTTVDEFLIDLPTEFMWVAKSQRYHINTEWLEAQRM